MERNARQQKFQERFKRYSEAQSKFGASLFYATEPVGYLALLLGGLAPLSGLGTGLIFGGIFCVANGFWYGSDAVADWQHFVALLLAGAILLLIAFRKRTKPALPSL